MTTETNRHRTRDDLVARGAVLCLRFGPDQPLRAAARAAVAGGLDVLEFTLTTPGALAAMAELAAEPGVIAGAGTVLTVDEVRAVAAAGGRFVMSPVCDAEVVAEAHRLDLLAVPGAATPGEILAAHRLGALLVKVFPSAALGGPAFLRAVHGPLPQVALVPTSGPTAADLDAYFAAGATAVGVGPDVFPPGWTVEGVAAAARRVRAALDAVPRPGRRG